MSENKTPIDAALDLLFFAPVGFALSVRELIPKLADRGRQQVTGQVTMARMVGEFAVQKGSQEAEKAVGKVRQSAESIVSGVNLGRPTTPTNGSSAATATAPAPTAVPPAAAPAPESPVVEAPTGSPSGSDTIDVYGRPQDIAPEVGSLAIPGYDTLSASQVVQRLAGLARDELEAVRAYEASSRGRKTILHKVEQLTAGTNGASGS